MLTGLCLLLGRASTCHPAHTGRAASSISTSRYVMGAVVCVVFYADLLDQHDSRATLCSRYFLSRFIGTEPAPAVQAAPESAPAPAPAASQPSGNCRHQCMIDRPYSLLCLLYNSCTNNGSFFHVSSPSKTSNSGVIYTCSCALATVNLFWFPFITMICLQIDPFSNGE